MVFLNCLRAILVQLGILSVVLIRIVKALFNTLLGNTYSMSSIGWHFVRIYFNEKQSTVTNVFGLI